MKKSILLGVMITTLSLPNIASAHCDAYKKGPYTVSCESGVQVYRHDARSLPRLDPNVQAQIEIAKINDRTRQEAIASNERIARVKAQNTRRRDATDRFFQRSLVENPSNLSRLGFNNSRFNNNGFVISRFGRLPARDNRFSD